MGIFDFGDDDDSAPQQLEAFPGQRKLLGELAGAAEPGAFERLGRAGEAFPGQLTAGLSDFEQLGLGSLGDKVRGRSLFPIEPLDDIIPYLEPIYLKGSRDREVDLG